MMLSTVICSLGSTAITESELVTLPVTRSLAAGQKSNMSYVQLFEYLCSLLRQLSAPAPQWPQ
eukprot:155926-Hanusia_phi.AAC.1